METLQNVHDWIVAEFKVEGALAATDPLLGRILDSMGLLRLVAFLEERFGFEVGENDLTPENFGTLVRIQAFVERKQTRT